MVNYNIVVMYITAEIRVSVCNSDSYWCLFVKCSAMLRACPALAFLRSAPLMGYGGNVAAASLCVKVRSGGELRG